MYHSHVLGPPAELDWRRTQGLKILKKYPPSIFQSLVTTHGSPLLLLSRKTITQQYQALQTYFPRAKHHYALKPLPHPAVVATIKELGGYFDLATTGEIEVVRQIGVDPTRCIHTHPIKRLADVQAGLDFGVTTFVFDNEYELEKLVPFREKIKLLLRLSFPNPEAQADLSAKFGIAPNEAIGLLQQAKNLGFTVIGLSFHVGSQIETPAKHLEALAACHKLREQAQSLGVAEINIIDIGGGFPISYIREVQYIGDFLRPIREKADLLFPPDVQIYTEPGRFVAGPAVTSICSVIGRAIRRGRLVTYLDDGLYNSYSGILFDHGKYLIYALKEFTHPDSPTQLATLAGPTCDSIDVMYEDLELPPLDLGDILFSPMMGAYAGASHATDFNYFRRPEMIVID